jgi:hypothetical protein
MVITGMKRVMAVCSEAYGKGIPTKSAATDFAAVIFTVQDAPETELHPVHPLKKDPGDDVAVSVTTEPPS